MSAFLKKFTSRKFLLALIATIAGVVAMCGVPDGVVEAVSAALTALIPTVIYIITEGRIDAAAVGQIAGAVQDVAESVADNDKESGGAGTGEDTPAG